MRIIKHSRLGMQRSCNTECFCTRLKEQQTLLAKNRRASSWDALLGLMNAMFQMSFPRTWVMVGGPTPKGWI